MVPSASGLRFCSITDAKYVAQVIVMHRSLSEALSGARMEVLCADRRACRALEELALPGLQPVAIEELEERDPELRAVRPERSLHEYCQTAKPALCLDMLRRHREASWVSYVDADSMFFGDPLPVFEELGRSSNTEELGRSSNTEELGGSSIGIVGHRFAPRFRSRERWGSPFCPSWVSFATDPRGAEVAEWWRARCLEWCFHRVEGERHSDQGYLRDWPERFEGVHIIQHPGIGPAPWTRNDGLRRTGAGVTIDGAPLILFHYQSLRVHRRSRRPGAARPLAGAPVPFSWRIHRGYRISARERELVWEPYLERLAEAIGELREVDRSLVDDELRAPDMRAMAGAARQYLWMRKHDLAAALRPGRTRAARS